MKAGDLKEGERFRHAGKNYEVKFNDGFVYGITEEGLCSTFGTNAEVEKLPVIHLIDQNKVLRKLKAMRWTVTDSMTLAEQLEATAENTMLDKVYEMILQET